MPRFYDAVKDDFNAIQQATAQQLADAVSRALNPLQGQASDALEKMNLALSKLVAVTSEDPKLEEAKAATVLALQHVQNIYNGIGS